MRLSGIQKVLWGLAGIALLAFAAFQFASNRVDTDADVSDPAFRAAFELTDQAVPGSHRVETPIACCVG